MAVYNPGLLSRFLLVPIMLDYGRAVACLEKKKNQEEKLKSSSTLCG